MTDEEWMARLRAFDRCREAQARTLEAFRAQIEAARCTLGRLIEQVEAERAGSGAAFGRRPRLARSWRTRAPRPGSWKHARAVASGVRVFTAHGEPWSVWQTVPARPALFVVGRATGEGDRGTAGWLTFMAGSHKRRYSPVPEGWQELPEDRLRQLLRESR